MGEEQGFQARRALRCNSKPRLPGVVDCQATRGMKMLDTPGVGLAFLDGGKTIWAGGLGVKELGTPGSAGTDTLFIAASNTKALTTLLLTELADEGRMR